METDSRTGVENLLIWLEFWLVCFLFYMENMNYFWIVTGFFLVEQARYRHNHFIKLKKSMKRNLNISNISSIL